MGRLVGESRQTARQDAARRALRLSGENSDVKVEGGLACPSSLGIPRELGSSSLCSFLSQLFKGVTAGTHLVWYQGVF